ncbi:MAG: sarcosine oxidase subunit gamma family protein [Gemmatimonadota bacterium]
MAEPTRHSPLAGLEAEMEKASWTGAALEPAPFFAQTGLRAAPPARARLEATLGTPLPPALRFTASKLGDVLSVGPDEWLIVGPDGSGDTAAKELTAAAGGEGAVTPLSGNVTGLLLRGAAARDVLATCCALDLHPRAFSAGYCGATLLAKAPVIIQQLDAAPGYRLLFRPSLAAYVVGWLVQGIISVRAAP